jgi:regulator of protease activity HflC (stomatin/prohibitin superfamily)
MGDMTMEALITIILLVVILVLLVIFSTVRRFTILEYQRGLFYSRGKFVRLLDSGDYWYFRPLQFIQKIDLRKQVVSIPGQELLSADNVSLKVSLAAAYQIADPYLAINQVADYQSALYLLLQLNLRDVIGALEVDELLAKRAEIGKLLLEKSTAQAAELGLQLNLVNIKDMMFPGDLKAIFAQVVSARKAGLASLERARGESAALRNLSNAAKLLDGNPGLSQLRLFQLLESTSGNTVVILPGEGQALLEKTVKNLAKS